MRKFIALGAAALSMVVAGEAEAQLGGRLSVEPYVAYGFFGELPEGNGELEADVAFGGRVGFLMAPQWGFFGNFQRATPTVAVGLPGIPLGSTEINVDHWSGGVEFSYVPRGGAEGMLPILLEAGLGQTRYEGGTNDLAVNIGIASALQVMDNVRIRYGANDYISNFGDNVGVVNQIFVRVGAELSL